MAWSIHPQLHPDWKPHRESVHEHTHWHTLQFFLWAFGALILASFFVRGVETYHAKRAAKGEDSAVGRASGAAAGGAARRRAPPAP